MPDYLFWTAVVGAALLVMLVVLVLVALGRLRSLTSSAEQAGALATDLAVLKAQGQDFERNLTALRNDHSEAAKSLRSEVGDRLHQFTDSTQLQFRDFDARLGRFTQLTQDQLKQTADANAVMGRTTADRLDQLREANDQRLESVRRTLEQRLDVLRAENAEKLEQMRATVDEKLQQTLETRLGESFRQVSDWLGKVHQGLGDMQKLAAGVGDLKRVLTNVKSRGTWGEVQLGTLLGDLLQPHQYATNVNTVPGSRGHVEFAIRVPARPDEPPCWIPVDSKFPVAEWERLQAALERADANGAESARKALAQTARTQARKVRDSYVCPPHTSDFAFLFLPTESLYAELMARPGLFEELQRDFRVLLAGPSNFVAFLNVIQMGFQRVALEQRSMEAWQLLGAVRTEFGKFGEIIAKAQKKLEEASTTLNEAQGKTTTISRKLREVQTLPDVDAARLLTLPLPIDLAPDAESPDVK
jgi:DNA recombination protein RmuC